jgi:hypothetical protein
MAPPILVTGSHRSGTTWVGRMLALDRAVEYIHEPFNVDAPRPAMRVRPPHWFEYVCAENEAQLLAPVSEMIRGDYRRPARGLGRQTGQGIERLVGKALTRPRRPLLKDPIALFASEWLADRFGCQVVVMIRHPAAFASSLKKLDWRFDFSNWTEQPLLLRDLAGPYEREIRGFAEQDRDIVDQAVLLWNVMHHVIDGYRERRLDWTFLRHEDVSETPVEHFRSLYRRLALRWSDDVAAQVRAASSEDAPAEVAIADRNLTVRNSRQARWTWRSRLTPEEQARVREGTHDVASRFYSDEDWAAPVSS